MRPSLTRLMLIPAVLFAMAAGAAGQGLQLEGGADDPLPITFIQQRIKQLDFELNKQEQKLRRMKDDDTRLEVRATIRLRQVAKQLLVAARDGRRAEQGPAAIAGMTLAKQAEAFDKMLDEFNDMSFYVRQHYEASLDRRRRVDAARMALEQFIVDTNSLGKLNRPSPAEVDAFCQKHLARMLIVAEAMERPVERSGWVAVDPKETSIGELRQRVRAVRSVPEAQSMIDEMLETLVVARQFPDYRHRVDSVLMELGRVLDLLGAMDQADWLSDEARKALETRLAAAVEQYADPKTRAQARSAMDELTRLTPTLAEVTDLRQKRINTRNLEPIVSSAVTGLADEATRAAARGALAWLDRLLPAMEARRQLMQQQAPSQIRVAMQKLGVEMNRVETTLLKTAEQVAEDLSKVNSPDITASTQVLTTGVAEMRQLTAVTEAMRVAGDAKPQPANGVNRRIYDLAKQIAESGSASATAELAQFVDQAERFDTLPGEAMLRQNPQGLAVITDQAEDLLEVITRQRQAWATAWAAGGTPREAASKLEPYEQFMRIVLAMSAVGTDANAMREATDRLNRWAAVEIEREALVKAMEAFEKLDIEEAALLASRGDTDGLRRRVRQMASQWRWVLVLAEAQSQLNKQLSKLPDGAAGALAQTALPPRSDAALVEVRESLAMISLYVNEWHALDVSSGQRAVIDPKTQDVLARHGNRVAKALRGLSP